MQFQSAPFFSAFKAFQPENVDITNFCSFSISIPWYFMGISDAHRMAGGIKRGSYRQSRIMYRGCFDSAFLKLCRRYAALVRTLLGFSSNILSFSFPTSSWNTAILRTSQTIQWRKTYLFLKKDERQMSQRYHNSLWKWWYGVIPIECTISTQLQCIWYIGQPFFVDFIHDLKAGKIGSV